MTLISFIIPAKNEEQTLTCCLESIVRQHGIGKYYEIEIILVDNNSNDDTVPIAQSCGAKVIHVPIGNISHLRNCGANESKGDYLCFIDADCILPHNWLPTCLRHLQTNKCICAVTSPEGWYGDHPTWVEKCWCKMKHPNRKKTETVSWCSSQAMLVQRKIFFQVNGFNEGLVTCEDADLGYRISRHCNILLDHSIRHQHIRGSKTLQELFFREMWRGKGNFQGVLSHGLRLTELPSLIIPLLFGIALIAGIFMLAVLIFYKNSALITFTTLCLFITISLPALMATRKLAKSDFYNFFFLSYTVCFTYLTARFLAFFVPASRKSQ